MRKIPEVWIGLGQCLHQDYLATFPDFWTGVDEFVSELPGHERREQVSFLRNVMDDEPDNGSLRKVWNASGAQVLLAARGGSLTTWKWCPMNTTDSSQ